MKSKKPDNLKSSVNEVFGRNDRVHYFDEVDSTMSVARKMAKEGCPAYTTVVADRQTSGRGRMDREWSSQDGGLYTTIVLRPGAPHAEGYKYNFIAGFLLADMLRTSCGIEARLKWPNDILVDGKKISGMLSEIDADAGRINSLNIGIGLNVNNNVPKTEAGASSIYELTGKRFSRSLLLRNFLDALEGGSFDNMTPAAAIKNWKKYACGLDRQVRVVTTKALFEGIAEDVDDSGALIIRQDNGSLQKVAVGDCFINPGQSGKTM